MSEAFDWVTARAECSAAQMFGQLFDRIEADALALQRRGGPGVDVRLTRTATNNFGVSKRYDTGGGVIGGEGVLFERTEGGVSVSRVDQDGRRDPLFEALVELDPMGRCRYVVVGAALELWQISRMALEPLFFT